MAMTEVKAFEYECDGCGSVEVVTDPEMLNGYDGEVSWQTMTSRWYACKKACIAKAVTNVFAR